MAGEMHVLEMKGYPSVSTLGDEGYSMVFWDGQRILYSEGATFGAIMRHGIRQGTLYRLLGKPVSGSREILDAVSVSVIEGEREAFLKMTLIDEKRRSSYQSAIVVDVFDLGGCFSESTFLARMDC